MLSPFLQYGWSGKWRMMMCIEADSFVLYWLIHGKLLYSLNLCLYAHHFKSCLAHLFSQSEDADEEEVTGKSTYGRHCNYAQRFLFFHYSNKMFMLLTSPSQNIGCLYQCQKDMVEAFFFSIWVTWDDCFIQSWVSSYSIFWQFLV